MSKSPLPPSSTPALSNSADVIALSRLRADVGRSLAQRGHALLEASDLEEQVIAMPAMSLYYTIKELGVDEAAPLLLAASDEQRQAFVDLDCWDADTFEADELDAWLAPYLQHSPDALADAFLALDEEVQILFLQASLHISDIRAETDGDVATHAPDAPPEDVPNRQMPDGSLGLSDITNDREVPPFALIDALMGRSMSDTYRLLAAARGEMLNSLQEEAFHFRTARLMDVGFRPAGEAARLFAAPPVQLAKRTADALAAVAQAEQAQTAQPGEASRKPAAAHGPSVMPAIYAAVLRDPAPLFTRALAQISDEAQLVRLESDLVWLINAGIVAWGFAAKNIEQVHDVANWVRDTLSLGLEQLTQQQPQVSLPAWLGAVPLMHMFQQGMAAVRPLGVQARQGMALPHVVAWLEEQDAAAGEADSPDVMARAFLRGLASPRPFWAGFAPERPRAKRVWQTLQDVQQTQVVLDALLARLAAATGSDDR